MVTLITGDRVVLDGQDRVLSVRPADGRERIPISVQAGDDKTRVLPADAARLVARGVLDERLFDVSTLVEFGYDDASRNELPIIVTGSVDDSKAITATRRAEGAEVTRKLASVNGAAAEVDRDSGAAFWNAITSGNDDEARTLSAGIEKVWLDGRVEASLDESVPQIGAPEAWDADFDGDGVTVAVLDTGIDDTHPDLKGRVVEASNFSDAEDTVDRDGHGTHVASIVAGNGTSYRGVAPGARLLNGKVLDDNGWGTYSGIIAGMQWAIDEGAEVVNLSLGGEDTADVDPLEQAVETLTAESGALFVVAAGNAGPSPFGTVSSPATAPSALAVGAVDKQDALAEFSSWGPTADGRLKPEITAPGAEITAARADGAEGEGPYVTYDGTSMATPHVAGAAAILTQQHPDWDAAQIKASLTASAAPGEVSAYAQGAGRVDLARAITQTVTADPGAVDFGVHEYPHEQEPTAQKLTYYNAGDQPVGLDLAVSAYGPKGDPAPEAMFTIDASDVTVPAGGEATVTVTTDTRMDSPHGVYGGTITATSADTGTTVSTAVGVWKQGPTHDLSLTVLDADGEPTDNADVLLLPLDTDEIHSYIPDADGRVTLRFPEGSYHLHTWVWTGADEDPAAVVKPTLELIEDTELTFDARDAVPFDITVPNLDATPSWALYRYSIGNEVNGLMVSDFRTGQSPETIRVADLGSPSPEVELEASVAGAWTVTSPGSSPEWYHARWERPGTLLAGLSESPEQDQFATIDTTFGLTSTQQGATLAGWQTDMGNGWMRTDTIDAEADLPARGANYVLGNGAEWFFGAAQLSGDEERDTNVLSEYRAYEPSEALRATYNVGVFGPSLTGVFADREPGVFRAGESYWAFLPTFGDGAGNTGYSRFSEATSSLRFNGDEVAVIDYPLSDNIFPVGLGQGPTDAGHFELTTDVTRAAEISKVSSRVQATWTGNVDAAPDGDEIQEFPLSVVRFSPELSLRSTAPAGRAMRIPFTVEGAAEDNVKKLSIEVSYDEGETWKPVKMLAGDRFLVKHPKKPGSVSLRANLTDNDGNTLEQTIQRAYLTVPAEPEPTEPSEPAQPTELTPQPTEPSDTKTPASGPPNDEPGLPRTGATTGWWPIGAAMLLIISGGALVLGHRACRDNCP